MMDEQWTAIIELFLRNNNQSEIMKLFNFPKSRRKFVYLTIKRYHDTGSVLDKPRPGRLVTVTTKKMENIVRCLIFRTPRRSLRKMAAGFKMSQGSLCLKDYYFLSLPSLKFISWLKEWTNPIP